MKILTLLLVTQLSSFLTPEELNGTTPVALEDGTPVISINETQKVKREAHRYSYKLTRKRINFARKELDADIVKSLVNACITSYADNGLPIYDANCTRAAIDAETSRRERVGRDITNAIPTLALLLREILK